MHTCDLVVSVRKCSLELALLCTAIMHPSGSPQDRVERRDNLKSRTEPPVLGEPPGLIRFCGGPRCSELSLKPLRPPLPRNRCRALVRYRIADRAD